MIRKLLPVIYSCALLGLFGGLLAGMFEINSNRYLPFRLFRPAATSLQTNWNQWALLTLEATVAIVLAVVTLRYFLKFISGRASLLLDHQKFPAAIVSVLIFLFGGWYINVHWLPQWYMPVSLFTDFVILIVSLFIGWIFFRSVSKPSYIKAVRALLVVAVTVLLALNIGLAIDRKKRKVTKPNIVWILIDALRADHLGTYGYKRNTSPNLDRFAGENFLFRNAFSQESYTQASVPSFFTSTYPFVHKVLYDNPEIDTLNSKYVTLAEILKQEGYSTAAFVFNPHLKAAFNFQQGFDVYDDNKEGFDYTVPFYETFETAKKILQKTDNYLKHQTVRPVFLYLHYRDVHDPYAPPPPYDRMFLPPELHPQIDTLSRMMDKFGPEKAQNFVDLYDGEIRYTDMHFAKLLQMLQNFGIHKENTIVIVTADHGEEFYDSHGNDRKGTSHGRTLYREQIHVPLLLSVPGKKGKEIQQNVGLIDLAPTLLDLLGIPWKQFEQFQGRSLVSLMEQSTPLDSGPVLSGGNRDRITVLTGNWKYYRFESSCKNNRQLCFVRPSFQRGPSNYIEELYNVKLDPLETQNRIQEDRQVAAALKKTIPALERFAHSPTTMQLDEETRDQLKALGYIER